MSEKLILDTTSDQSWSLKWKGSVRKRAINILALIENDGKPTQEMGLQIRKLHEAFTYWNSDVATWEKHRMIVPIYDPVKPQEDMQKPHIPKVDGLTQ
jgi:hypothetical protein|tara:strand:- start:54 stop:347 length:294 start_codon:yes stop_codon:yes gene_type:complete